MALRDPNTEESFAHRDAGLITYEADWYSGSQIQVLMGDILIDNAVAISYQVSANRIPIYGFGSEYFAFTAKGHTFITGDLTVAFKETQYILKPALRYHNLVQRQKQWDKAGKGKAGLITSRRGSKDGYGDVVIRNQGGFESLSNSAGSAHQKINQYYNIEQAISQFAKDPNRKLPAGLIKQLDALDDSTFEDIAEVFEDVVWYGSNINSPRSRQSLNKESLSHDAEWIDSDEELALRRLDQYPPVDITITYGDMEAPDTVNHTVQKLLDVSFTGESKQIIVGGQPVLESYSFIARNRV
jgi:hypothetical protein